MMAWTFLFAAGLFEIGWAIGIKYTNGFTRLVPSVLTLLSMIVSVVFLGLAVRTLPIGTAYTIWGAIGTIGTVVLGILLFDDPASAARLGCICLILIGSIGLKLAT